MLTKSSHEYNYLNHMIKNIVHTQYNDCYSLILCIESFITILFWLFQNIVNSSHSQRHAITYITFTKAAFYCDKKRRKDFLLDETTLNLEVDYVD